MAMIEVVMTSEEVSKNIAYQMICQTRYGSVWNTMKCKLRWNKEFSDNEKEKAEKIFRQAHSWFVGKGIPDTVRMDFPTFELWNKIETFCGSL